MTHTHTHTAAAAAAAAAAVSPPVTCCLCRRQSIRVS